MTTKTLNPRDTTRILNLARKGMSAAGERDTGPDDNEYALLEKCGAIFAQIVVIAKGIDARETRRDPSLRRKPAKKRS